MNTDSPLDVQRHGKVVELILGRPERLNALNRATVEALRDAYATAAEDDAHAVVLRGAGQ